MNRADLMSLFAATLLASCTASAPPDEPARLEAQSDLPAPTGDAPPAAERAPVAVDGNVVHVNNTICAVSRSEMAPEALGQFVSRVEYTGDDPRFRGRVFEFNQCCGGCVERFPSMWAERADEILAYHGVSQRTDI